MAKPKLQSAADQLVFKQFVERLVNDFEFFANELWNAVGLPDLANHQRQQCRWLQYGPTRRGVRAFRGASKTWITLAYCAWRLFVDSNERVMLVSKSEKHSKDSLYMVRKWLTIVPWLNHMIPNRGQRDSAIQFDIGPAPEDRTPSFSAYGIGGQLTGARATLIVSDDVETRQNTLTLEMRQRLREDVKEYENILIPGGDIVMLGTPHNEESLYDDLANSGYTFRSWPARYPTMDERVDDLAPEVVEEMENGAKVGDSLWPSRFSTEILIEREASIGRSTFAMQYMMITSLGDELKYPLRLADFIVFPVQKDKAPVTIAWGTTNDRGGTTRCQDIMSLGFGNDGFFSPIMFDQEWDRYTGTKMWIDPSGRGKDLTAYGIASHCRGVIYIKALGGMPGGYEIETLEALAKVARLHGAREIWCEDNFGLGMFAELFRPVLRRHFVKPGPDDPLGWGASLDTIPSRGQKEVRIIESLEGPLGSHRIVIPPDVAADQDLQRQLTRITRQRNCLESDDKIEVLGGVVNLWADVMGHDVEQSKGKFEQEQFDKQLQAHQKAHGLPGASGPNWINHDFKQRPSGGSVDFEVMPDSRH